MEKIKEQTEGTHVYMMLQLDDGAIEEIDAYFCPNGTRYRTTGDGDAARRDRIISAFQALY